MFKRSEAIFKLLCAGVAALVLFQLVTIFLRSDPLARVNIPALPSLAGASEASERKDANSAATNTATKAGTNITSDASIGKATNTAAPATNSVAQGTNSTVAPAGAKPGTNAASELTTAKGTSEARSNSAAISAAATAATNAAQAVAVNRSTNALAKGTNTAAPGTKAGTNAVAESTKETNNLAQGTNSMPRPGAPKPGASPGPGPELAMGGMMPGRMGGPNRGPQIPVPPEIQARVDRIVESEILAPVMHPMPMALLGIAGQSAFLRAPNGQTGLIKEGEDLGGVKLLEIGINRVLVQDQGEKKELTIFEGFGSESLLSTPQEKSPNETTKK